MLASHKWLMQLSGLAGLAPADVARRLTAAGLEVEATRAFGDKLDAVVVAEVRGQRPHPQRDKLRLVRLFDGEGEHEVVCGAPNVPEAGGLVAFARLGASLPNGVRIEERKLGGVLSRGMICSETELDLGADSDGILILDPAAGVSSGVPLADALGLRDTVFEIGLTPNRPDCLGHVGLARELCVLYDAPFELPAPQPLGRGVIAAGNAIAEGADTFTLFEPKSNMGVTAAALPAVAVEIHAPERCPRYGAALVAGVKMGPTPFQLRYRLHTLGLRSISNVVDATNLIMLGWGQPIHAFDLHKLGGPRIDVRLARAGERMQTLDGQERSLSDDDLLICDARGPVALAGVMGGANSEIGPDTRDVLIEVAYFDPRSVRRTSKRTGLHTDSSHRFERGVDPLALRAVLADAASLVAALADGAVVSRAFDVQRVELTRKRTSFRPARAQALLGRPVTAAEARPIFERLGCDVTPRGADLEVTLPSFRPDLTREVDLIEELARVVGYDTIPTALPSLRPSSHGSAPEIGFLRRLREVAVAQGLAEAVNYAFVAQATLDKARAPSADRAPRLANPMSEERSVLRTAVLPGLLVNLRGMQRHQQRRFAAFELARVFAAESGVALPRERYEFAAVLWGLRQSWYEEREEFGFYDAKGLMESVTHALVGEVGVTELEQALSVPDRGPLRPAAVRPAAVDGALRRAPAQGALAPTATEQHVAEAEPAPSLHPKRNARVMCGGSRIGVLGELHPDVVSAFDLQGRAVVLVLDVASLLAAAQARGTPSATPLPRFPAATRDLAVVVAEAIPSGDVAQVLGEVAGELAESVRLFDIYRGAPVPEGHKSLAFHVVYRDPAATLTDKRVDEVHGRVTAQAEARFAGSVRK